MKAQPSPNFNALGLLGFPIAARGFYVLHHASAAFYAAGLEFLASLLAAAW